jgi:riboflavin kinase/FMN adenylyltransferase
MSIEMKAKGDQMEVIAHYKDLKSVKGKAKNSDIQEIKHLKKPIALTIGNFDGMHLGHKEIFKTLRSLARQKDGSIVVLTFSNHPLEVIDPCKKIPKITPLEEKLELFKEEEVDLVICTPFTKELQLLTHEEFLKEIRENLSFDYLVLGEDASFGKDREGTQEKIQDIEKTYSFKTFYIPKVEVDQKVVCSRLIREKLYAGEVEHMPKLLGRAYGLYAPFHIETLQEIGENKLRITFDFQNHCLIPSGYYVVNLKTLDHECIALAHLTTLSSDEESKTFDLEIFIKGKKSPFMNDHIKIEFLRKTSAKHLSEELEGTSCKIFPINPSKTA